MSYLWQNSFRSKIDCFYSFHCIVFKLRILEVWLFQFFSYWLLEHGGLPSAFSLALTTCLHVSDLPLPFPFAKYIWYNQSMVFGHKDHPASVDLFFSWFLCSLKTIIWTCHSLKLKSLVASEFWFWNKYFTGWGLMPHWTIMPPAVRQVRSAAE